MMLIDCQCGATNRIPGASRKRHRCGKCQHVFTPQELVKARPEPPPERPSIIDMLTGGMFPAGLKEATHACKDEENCGWEGTAEELEDKRCPECGKRVRKLEE